MKPSRKERELEFRTELVLTVAERVFAQTGFQGASVEKIARESELSIGSLYNLFPGKEALFAAVIERRQGELLQELAPILAGDRAAILKLEELVAFIFDYFEKHSDLFHLFVSATNGFQWSIRPTLGEKSFRTHLAFLEAVADLCREGMRRDGWQPADAMGLAWAIVGTLNAFLTRWITATPRPPLPSLAGDIRVLLRRLVAAPPPPTTPARSRRK